MFMCRRKTTSDSNSHRATMDGWAGPSLTLIGSPALIFLFFFAQRHRRRLPTIHCQLFFSQRTFLFATNPSPASTLPTRVLRLPTTSTYSTSLPAPTALHTLPRYFFSFEIFLYPLKRRLHNSKRFKVGIGFIHRYDHFRLLSFLCILLSLITLFLSISHLLPSPPTPHSHPPLPLPLHIEGNTHSVLFF